MKRVRIYGREVTITGHDVDETYRLLPADADLVDPVLSAFARYVTHDSCCVDVGAGLGLHTVALSLLAPGGRVLSIEPSPGDFALLEQNLIENQLENVTACPLWPAEDGTAAAPFLERGISRVSSPRAWTVARDATTGAGTTLDDLVENLHLGRVDVLRVSLQGAELGVLEGASDILRKWQPAVFVVFNSFEIAARQGMLPHVALARLRDVFPYCHVLDRVNGSPAALCSDAESNWFLYDNSSHGPVDDLLCTFEPVGAPAYTHRPSLPTAGELTTAVSQREMARKEAAVLRQENELLRRRSTELERARERAAAETEALRATLSWRVTSPLREVRARVGRVRARGGPDATDAADDGSEPPLARGERLPIPPFDMRQLVGPTDEESFDNPTGALVFPELSPDAYGAVFDFGCGCGRIARKLIQQRPRPDRYVGVDLHQGMIDWCRANLAPAAPGFEFLHHDVLNPSLNPGCDKPLVARFPVEDASFSLVLAWSVFTHLTEAQVGHYLSEVSRVLRPGGVALTTWFLFDKAGFPMMQEFQNALYINPDDVTNAVIFDRGWVRATATAAGLTIVGADPPTIRGYQWRLWLSLAVDGRPAIELPSDDAPVGSLPPPLMPEQAAGIGQ